MATIANNFIFYKVMRHNPDLCKELLEILLEMEIDHIEMRGEETIEIDFGSKGIRLDVYAKNMHRHLIWKCNPQIQKNSPNGQDTTREAFILTKWSSSLQTHKTICQQKKSML